jgi:hypothetical protein
MLFLCCRADYIVQFIGKLAVGQVFEFILLHSNKFFFKFWYSGLGVKIDAHAWSEVCQT